ncbi:MAG: MraY family glycosyltransferase [Prolixibacteraceae bacterium]|jgi:UDP-N-acetylmuramyl pentapeptide phosphotransferase/UDP-N-acetylglucosamine-1-phosphate transferase
MSPIIQIIASFLIGSALVYFTIPVIVRLSIAKKLVDVPNERKVNKTPIPNLGGVALFLGITIATLLSIHKNPFPDFRYLQAGMIILFFIGVKDDILIISPRKKFIAQLISAFIIIIPGGIRFTNLHGLFGFYEIDYGFSFALTTLAIVAIINALNLIDGIDGLASAIGILASMLFGILFYFSGHINYTIVSFAITGSLISFFFFNVFGRKNKIFMGDTGSLLLGLLLSVFAIKYNEFSLSMSNEARSFAPVLSLAILAIPIFDMIRLFAERILKNKSPFAPDINHIHHKILKLGFNHLNSTLILISANLILIAFVFAFRSLNNHILLFMLILLGTFFSFIPRFFYEYRKAENSTTKKLQFSLFFMPFKKFQEKENDSTELLKD